MANMYCNLFTLNYDSNTWYVSGVWSIVRYWNQLGVLYEAVYKESCCLFSENDDDNEEVGCDIIVAVGAISWTARKNKMNVSCFNSQEKWYRKINYNSNIQLKVLTRNFNKNPSVLIDKWKSNLQFKNNTARTLTAFLL